MWLFEQLSFWHCQVATGLDIIWQPVKCWLPHITDCKDGCWWMFDAMQLKNTVGSCHGCFFWLIESSSPRWEQDRVRSGSRGPKGPPVRCRRTTPACPPAGPSTQNTRTARIKAIVSAVIIILVNTVPKNDMFGEHWSVPFGFTAMQ